nr:solute carrier family 49 member 4 isoform X3 [Crassostrea gigas]
MTTGSTQVTELRVHGVRWYLLSVVSLHCCLQNAVWAAFPPIAQSAKLVYDWTDSDINMSLIYGNIGTIVLLLPMIWIVFAKGMRTALLLSTFLTAIGTALKALPVGNNLNSWLIPIGLFLNGCGGAVTSVGATVLSETWFPPSQRATATVFYLVSAAVGGALVFIVGPAVVPEPIALCDNITWSKKSNCSEQNKSYINSHEVQEGLKVLNITECSLAVLLLISVIFHFPNKPLHPPSVTANTQRLGLREGARTAVREWRFWHLALCCAISTSVYASWLTTAEVVLHPFGISQKEAGWMSFSGAIGGTLFGMVLSRLSDIFHRKMKVIMMAMFSIATVFYLLFILMLIGVVPNEHCTMWPNWAVFVTSLLSVVVLYLFKEEYRRLDIDLPVSQSEDSDPEHNRF